MSVGESNQTEDISQSSTMLSESLFGAGVQPEGTDVALYYSGGPKLVFVATETESPGDVQQVMGQRGRFHLRSLQIHPQDIQELDLVLNSLEGDLTSNLEDLGVRLTESNEVRKPDDDQNPPGYAIGGAEPETTPQLPPPPREPAGRAENAMGDDTSESQDEESFDRNMEILDGPSVTRFGKGLVGDRGGTVATPNGKSRKNRRRRKKR